MSKYAIFMVREKMILDEKVDVYSFGLLYL